MTILSARRESNYAQIAITYFQKSWASEESKVVYEDCILNCPNSESPLPQWYSPYDGEKLIGCTGMIPDDLISRVDLYPWLCALYIEEGYRGYSYGSLLIKQIKMDAAELGYKHLYLYTDHVGYHEYYGSVYIAQGYHPWGESARICQCGL